jgi:tetratricopeptide (TPR) repeat protein
MRVSVVSMRRVGACLALAAAVGTRANGAESALLGEAKAMYRQLDYEKCVDRAKRASRAECSAEEQAEAALYEGICQFFLGRLAAAESAFERALGLNPNARLPAFSSPKLARFFEEIAASLSPRQTSPDSPPQTLEPEPAPAPAQPPTAPSAPSLSLSAPVPVSKPTGTWVAPALGVVALTSLGGGLASGYEAHVYETTANVAFFASDGLRYDHAARNAAIGANVCYGAAAAAGVAAIVVWLLEGHPLPGRP